MKLLTPDWPAPANVRAVITTRQGGGSKPPWGSFNLGLRNGDDEAHVNSNRRLLRETANLIAEPQWLHQVHGCEVVESVATGIEQQADAAVSRTRGLAAAVLTADCLPVLLCDCSGTVVAAAHAGWRGLAAGILRNTVASMGVSPNHLLAYLGPAISQRCFEVGPEVQTTFIQQAINDSHRHKIANCFTGGSDDRQQADLYALARAELQALGVIEIYGGEYCTYRQSELFYSYRRDGVTGRMASMIWVE